MIMHARPLTFGFLLALAAPGSTFFMPGPSRAISGRHMRQSTSKTIIFMGRGDVRTKKGKRMRHTYGKCRLRTKKTVLNRDGEVVVKAAPVARRWEPIEWVEPEVQAEGAAVANQEVVADAVEDESAEAMEVPEAALEIESVTEETTAGAVMVPEAEAVPEVAEEPAAEAVTIPEAEPLPESETESAAESPLQDAPKAEGGSDMEPAAEA